MIMLFGLPVVAGVAYCLGIVVASVGQQSRVDEAFLAGWRSGINVATPISPEGSPSAHSAAPAGHQPPVVTAARLGEEMAGYPTLQSAKNGLHSPPGV